MSPGSLLSQCLLFTFSRASAIFSVFVIVVRSFLEVPRTKNRRFFVLFVVQLIDMGKRYYCAYCDRSFKDDSEARKKHLSSLQHAKFRADHYNMYKDPEVILKEENAKIPCKWYLNVGDCAFGLGCRFSHYTPPMIWELQRLVAMKNQAKLNVVPENGWPNPDDIIKEYFENATSSSSTEDINYPTWHRPMELHDYSRLPPSLWPITPESLENSTFREWS